MNLLVIDCSKINSSFTEYFDDIHDTIVVYLHVTEYVGAPFNRYGESIDILKPLSDSFVEKNVQLYVVFGGHESLRYNELDGMNLTNIKFIYWSTFLLHYTYQMFQKKLGNIPEIKPSFDKLFISFNQKPKQHRGMFIDMIHKHDLTNFGLFSWNELLNEWSNNYTFKYWNERIVRIDLDKDRENLDVKYDYFTETMLNNGCLINVVGECLDNSDMFFITDKTFKNLLIGQPFVCIGSPFQNLVLENFGFKLYNEIFDYSFDQESNILERVEGVINNLESLKLENYNRLYESIKPKIEYNRKRCFQIISEKLYIPEKLMELYHQFPQEFKDFKDSYMGVDEYLLKILN